MVILVEKAIARLRRRFGQNSNGALFKKEHAMHQSFSQVLAERTETTTKHQSKSTLSIPNAHQQHVGIKEQLEKLLAALASGVGEKFELYGSDSAISKGHKAFCAASGFSLAKSSNGIFVSDGKVCKNQVVALFPGTVYDQHQAKLCSVLMNNFVYHCQDGWIVDGNTNGLARLTYRSCAYRDRGRNFLESDLTWLTHQSINPLAVGHLVKRTNGEGNACFKEIDLNVHDLAIEWRKFLPYVRYVYHSADAVRHRIRLVALVSTKEIACGESLICNNQTSSSFPLINQTKLNNGTAEYLPNCFNNLK